MPWLFSAPWHQSQSSNLILLWVKILHETLWDPLYHNDWATCIMISLRETGREGGTQLLDYVLMTILDQLLPRQCFSLVNWITYKMESHASYDPGFIQSIRRWWTWDKMSELYSGCIRTYSLMRHIGSNGNCNGRLLVSQSLTWEQQFCVNMRLFGE